MDKATVESVMALAFELARIREQHGAQSGMYLSEVRALRAEAERLAAQAAPTTADRWNDAALPPEIEQRLAPWLTNGAALHPATVNLVVRFARALSKKLAAAETKYGYSDGWLSPDWMDECRAKLMEHIAKGDPRDVAAYCAFLWHHGASTVTSQPSQAPVVQAVQAREYPPLPWGNQQPYVWFCRTKDTDLVAAFRAYVDADRASSGAAQAAPFAKDSWQHAVDNQLVAFGRTSQEFANPHEALAWLAIVNMELGQSNVGAAQAVRMLTREELNDVALSEKVGWGPGEYVEAVQHKFAEVNGLRIPADGKIGGCVMGEIKDGGPAFPVSTKFHEGEYGHQDGPQTWQFPGMTLRDYFAGQWLMGYMANPEIGFSETAAAAAQAYKAADAMLRARETNHDH